MWSADKFHKTLISTGEENMKRKKQGFTLVELMLVVGIISTLIFVPTLFIQMQRAIMSNKIRIELNRENQTVMSTVIRRLHQGKSLSIQISQYDSYQPIFSKVEFDDIGGGHFSFYQSGNDLIMTTPQGNSVLSKNLKSISFGFARSFEMENMNISLLLEKPTYEGQTYKTNLVTENVRILN